jgi:ribonuclease H / adenosylcobalamin/alpha-ribazole phosphatase
MPTRVVLCRHAEPEPWARGRFCGALDVGLSPGGAREARALGAALAGAGLQAVYTSPLRRARETADAVAAACALDVTELPGLAEIDFGELDGLTYDEARARFADVYDSWLASPGSIRLPGGECLDDVRTRATLALREILERHRDAAVAVVSHAGPLRTLIADVLLAPDEALFRITLDYASSSVVDWLDDGVPVLHSLNVRSASPAPAGRGGRR